MSIVLVPVGAVPNDLPAWLASQLTRTLGRDVALGATSPLPSSGYSPRRRQYRGGAFLTALHELPYPSAERLVGLTDCDCYARGLNFIFGQAIMNGREAFVALPRLRQTFYGLPPDKVLFYQRTLKEVIHELGHTWNLSHCPDATCVMRFSNSLHDTDVKGADFCESCRSRLARKKPNRSRRYDIRRD